MAKATRNVKTVDEPKLSAAGPTPPQTPAEVNPFELEGLIVKPSYKNPTNMVASALAIPVKDKAGSATFFMVHPDPAYAQVLYAIKWSEEGEETRGDWYVVHPNVAETIENDPALKAVKIYYCISQTGHEFLVVVPFGDGGKGDTYASKHAVFEAARSRYLKMYWVAGAKQWAYTYAEEGDKGPDIPPAWTEESYLSILKRGFKSTKQDHYVNTTDHFVMKAMRASVRDEPRMPESSDIELRKLGFARIIACDTEYWFGIDVEGNSLDGNPLRPVCICAKDLLSGEEWEIWLGEFPESLPFPVDETTLFIAFNASAEVRTFKSVDYPTPARILDLFAEFRDHRNGRDGETSRSLLSALTHFGLDTVGAVFKKQMIDRILKGPPFTEQERREILDYCWTDVYALERLLEAMLPHIDWKGALIRGRYAAAVASMEIAGIPVNVELLNEVVDRWSEIQIGLIREIDRDFGVYDGTTFKYDLFENYVERNGLPWLRLKPKKGEKIGALALDADTFGDMAKIFPAVAPLAELRNAIGKMRKNDVPVGEDGRARTGLRPFASSTSRNQPSTSEFLYGASKWIRNFIQPEPGYALLYFDFSAEEVGIAAALSGDKVMQGDYLNGDFYINFGVALGLLPPGCTKAIAEEHHHGVRDKLKVVCLATLYGMGALLLSMRIDKPKPIAAAWIRHHHHRYKTFWEFVQRTVDHLMRNGSLETELGFHLHPRRDPNPRSVANFPIQANAAEILRVACCLVTEAGYEVCAPVHDAILVRCKIEDIERTKAEVTALMVRASQIVLSGFALKVGVDVTRYPDHLTDKRGEKMWTEVMKQVDLLNRRKAGDKS